MRITFISIVCLFLLYGCGSSRQIFEPSQFEDAPEALILSLNSHSVVRNSETTVEVVNASEAYHHVKEAITIYKKDNKGAGTLVLGYSPLREIEYIYANLIDRNGRVVRTFTIDDAYDYSSYDGFSFFSDSRIKVLDVQHNSFPYTVQYEYRIKYNGTLFLPSWYPQVPGQSVEKASLKVIDETEKGVRFHTQNLDKDPVTIDSLGKKYLQWDVDFLSSKNQEDFGPPVWDLLPAVKLAPSEFEIEKTKGDASTWESFGKWYYELGEGSRTLSDEAKKEVDNVLVGKSTDHEKVVALYNYLQEKNRYVSIQLGIGGWKPFPAEYVFINEYGDCKALTNYMQAILEYAGIKSNAVLISSGLDESPMLVNFPSNQFNHVILRVELENGEMVWLECTSKYFPPGHIGRGNEDKNALLVTKEGGKVVKTPSSGASDNISSTSSVIELKDTGEAITNTKIKGTGVMQEFILSTLRPVSEAARIEWLQNQIDESNLEFTNTDFSGIDTDKSGVEISYAAKIPKFASASSSRLFVPLQTYNSLNFSPELDENRTQEIHLGYKFSIVDTTFYKIPDGYEIESIPNELSLNESFGDYSVDYIVENNQVSYTRKLVLNEKILPADEYQAFRNFFKTISETDRKGFVLVQK